MIAPEGQRAVSVPALGRAAIGWTAAVHGRHAWCDRGGQAAAHPFTPRSAEPPGGFLLPGNLLVSTSFYRNDPGIVAGQTVLPPGCTAGCVTATADGDYPEVWNNVLADPSFGVTSPVFLDQLTPPGRLLSVTPVPDGSQHGFGPKDHLVTSFSSKSEMALNLSPDGRYVTFMGYVAGPDSVDVSNSNTPAVIDPTNPVPGTDFRAAAQLTGDGRFRFTETNAYSGNNGRAAITAQAGGHDVIYTSGNAGNGANPQPDGVVLGAGTQILTPSHLPEAAQHPGQPSPVGSFSVTQLGDKPDKVGKDDNFRGLTIFNNVLYYTKGSGSNGVNTVYFLDTTGLYPAAAGQTTAGLQKWVLNAASQTWQLAYTLQAGLNLGQPYTVPGYPTGDNAATGLPWSPATDGLRNITGRVNPNGTVTIWGITSTVSGNGDQGADPNKLVAVTDRLSAASPAAGQSFQTVRRPASGRSSAASRSRPARGCPPAGSQETPVP
jgi:hypothetical protein